MSILGRMEPSERVTELINRFDERCDGRGTPCEVCGWEGGFVWVDKTIYVGLPETTSRPKGLETLAFMCRRCGNLRFHAAVILEMKHPNES
jgi:hypothetical protein